MSNQTSVVHDPHLPRSPGSQACSVEQVASILSSEDTSAQQIGARSTILHLWVGARILMRRPALEHWLEQQGNQGGRP